MTDNDIFESMLEQDNTKKQNDLDVLKELFTSKDVETKTELSIKQVILINQKRTISKLLDWDSLNQTLNDFMLLMISNNRKGRQEFVDGFKSDREAKIQESKGFGGWMKDKFDFK